MDSQRIILDHDRWRKGIGGAPAGLAGESDANAYAGLDLNLANFSASTFSGSSFSATTFKQAVFTGCQFTGCSFSACDFEGITMTGCSFSDCQFNSSQLRNAQFQACQFNRNTWNDLNFDASQWNNVDVLDCSGTRVEADGLHGDHVDFTGSKFEFLQFRNTRIN